MVVLDVQWGQTMERGQYMVNTSGAEVGGAFSCGAQIKGEVRWKKLLNYYIVSILYPLSL